jgi:hypothetical protein
LATRVTSFSFDQPMRPLANAFLQRGSPSSARETRIAS